jgi:uncharacterized membrane protein
MPTLIVIGCQDETTVAVAGEEVVRLSAQPGVPPEAVVVLTVDSDGVHRATRRMYGSGSRGGSIFWLALFGDPHLRDVRNAARRGRARRRRGVRTAPYQLTFADQVRQLLAPRASARFVLVDEADPDLLLAAVERYGGRALSASWGAGLPVPRHESAASSGREEAVDGRAGRLETNVAGDGGGSGR